MRRNMGIRLSRQATGHKKNRLSGGCQELLNNFGPIGLGPQVEVHMSLGPSALKARSAAIDRISSLTQSALYRLTAAGTLSGDPL